MRSVQPELGRLENECKMFVALARMLKRLHESLWEDIPNDDRTSQLCFFVDRSSAHLSIYGELETPVQDSDEALGKGREILNAIAAGVKKKKWPRPVHDKLVQEGEATLTDSLRSGDCEISNYAVQSLDRAEGLFDDFISVSSLGPRAVEYDKAKTVRVEVQDERPAAAYLPEHQCIVLRYLKRREYTALNLTRLLALPLYFFHEVFSHIAPRRDLHLSCSDGWMMEAAFRAWQLLIPQDNLIELEYQSLLKEIANDKPQALLKFRTSPFAMIASLFAVRYPQTFWELTLDLLELSERKPLEQKLMALLKEFLRDPPQQSPLWAERLDQLVRPNGPEASWPGLEAFCETLKETHSQISKSLGLRTFD